MKKRPILALSFIVLSSFILAVPYLIERHPLQDRLLGYLKQTYQCEASVGAISWRWLPVPTLTITQLRAEAEAFSLILPDAHLILNPSSLIFDEISLSYAKLIKPNLTIKARPERAQTEFNTDSLLSWIGLNPSLAGAITTGRFRIVDGTLSLPSHRIGNDLTLHAITLSGINGTLRCRSDSLKLDLLASSNFASALTLKGKIDLHPENYRLDFGGEGLDSGLLLGKAPHIPPQPLTEPEVCAVSSSREQESSPPVLAGLNFRGHFEGSGAGQFQLELESNTSPFSLQWQKQELRIEKVGSLTLSRHKDDFSLGIKELSVAEPKILLNGRLDRKMADSQNTDPPSRVWTIDLHGADIDLTALRSAILNIFKKSPIAQQVCAIVGGGRAAQASYQFEGRLADFKHLNSMKIGADAIEVPITIPGLGLAIDQASGPITIMNGTLSGENLSATIDKSHGTKGKILLDLTHDRHAFQLDLDLDADLQNLQDVLAQIIPSPKFQNELSRFSEIDGRAQGHLRLGDDLRHILTEVDVRKVEASGIYDRLPWPFSIDSGQLLLAPQQLDWQNVSAKLGRQRISATTGKVTWQDDIHATIKDLDADLDLKSLFEEGTLRTNKATLSIRDFSHGRIEELVGQAQLQKSFFSGPILRPAEWQYHTSINCRDLKVVGEKVPELSSQSVQAEISQQQVGFSGLFALLEDEISLSGNYRHDLYDNWRGDLEITGDFTGQLGEWLKEKQIIPTATFPKLPFRLENFILTNPEPGFDSILARGTLIPIAQPSDVKLQVSINRQATQTINTLTFLNGGRQGSINYQTWPEQGRRTLLTWQGELDAETLDLLYSQHFWESGKISGTFSRLIEQDTATYNGSLEAKGVRFRPESLTPDLTIDTLRLLGNDNTITIDQADLALADVPATLGGRVTEADELHTLALEVKAPALSWSSIQKVFEVYSKRAADDQGKSVLDTLRGTVKFDIDAFDYTHQTKNNESTAGEGESHTYTSSPFTGSINLKPAGIEMLISKSSVCGISCQATWYFGDETNDNALSFTSGRTPLSFEETLPCLGFKQSLIIGPLSLDGQISGRPKQWRQGTITLSSPEGLIKRMTLLSKIFTAVNVTDYFTWQDLPDLQEEGLSYNELKLKAHIDSNNLVLDRTVIKGKGVNLSGRGTINLTDFNADLTFFIAPFKTLDWLVTNIPLIGKALGGPKESILTFPVAVTGNIKSPEVTSLAPEAIGSAVLELFGDTVTLPFRIFQSEPESEQDEGVRTEDGVSSP